MSNKDVFAIATRAFRAKNFSKVISLLEPKAIEYRDSFDFYYMLGVSCLYQNDLGGAEAYFKAARRIRMTSAKLYLAQGTLYLRRGNTSRAVEYYLEALDYDITNKTAKKALKFISKHVESNDIPDLVRKGKIKKFYPKTGTNPATVPLCILFLLAAISSIYLCTNYKKIWGLNGTRADLTQLFLSSDEKSNPQETNLANSNYKYILTSSEITKAYEDAQSLFQKSNDNAALVKLNLLLNSNASTAIKYKANLLKDYLEEPNMATFTNDFSVKDVKKDLYLYNGCWVLWSGRIANETITQNYYFAELLVGFEDMKKLEDRVPIQIMQPISINPTEPIQVLGKIIIKDGNLALDVKSIYQPLKGN